MNADKIDARARHRFFLTDERCWLYQDGPKGGRWLMLMRAPV